MSPEKEAAQAQVALAQIAEAMTALRAVKSAQYAALREKIAETDRAAEKARSLFADTRRLQDTCDRAGIEVSAVLRRANTEGLL